MLLWNPCIIVCIVGSQNGTISVGQRWPIIPGRGSANGGAAALPYSVPVLMVTLSIDFGIATYYALFRIFDENGCSQHIRKESAKMSAVDKLVSYILELTPEQVDKVVSQLPRLTELLSGSSQPCLQEQSLQKQ